MPSLTGNDVSVNISTSADTSGITQTQEAIGELEAAQGLGAKSSINWSSEITKAGAVAGGLLGTIGLVTKGALDQASSYQQNRIAFETMLGSADKAKSLLMQISSFAAATPFELPQVVEGGKNLLAFGVSMDQIIPTFTMLGNIAAGVGTDKLPALINVFGQVKAAGRLMSQDLLQFTSAGVPVIDLLAQHYGITSDKVKDLVATGKVGFDDLNASLSLLGGPSGKWGDLMEKQSKSLNGTLSNVQDNLGRILRQAVGIGPDGDIRQGSLFDFVTKGANGLMNGLSKLQPFIDKIANFFEKNHTAVIALAGAIGGILLGVIVAIVVAIGWIPLAIVAGAAIIGAIVSVIIAKWKEWHNWIIGIGVVLFGAVAIVAIVAIEIIRHFDSIKNFASAALDWIMDKVNWLKDNWLQAIGFVVGFFATLPFKLPIYIYNAFSAIIGFLMSINWGGVFSGIGHAIASVAGDIWNYIYGAFKKITSLNWGQITIQLGKDLGNALIDLLQGAINGALHSIPGHPHISLPHFARGVQNFGGGLAVVGEEGPEIVNLPPGSDVYPHGTGPTTNNRTVSIGTIVLGTAQAAREFFDQLDNDTLLAGKGMTPARGGA